MLRTITATSRWRCDLNEWTNARKFTATSIFARVGKGMITFMSCSEAPNANISQTPNEERDNNVKSGYNKTAPRKANEKRQRQKKNHKYPFIFSNDQALVAMNVLCSSYLFQSFPASASRTARNTEKIDARIKNTQCPSTVKYLPHFAHMYGHGGDGGYGARAERISLLACRQHDSFIMHSWWTTLSSKLIYIEHYEYWR